MIFKQLSVPPIGTNCYIFGDDATKMGAIVDPGGDAAGILAALKRGSLLDKGIKTFCLILQSAPVFWFGLLMLTVFSVILGWFPIGQAVPMDA